MAAVPERVDKLTQQELLKLFPFPGPGVPRFSGLPKGRIVLNSEAAAALAGAIGGGAGSSLVAPVPSYQWLFFDTLDGGVPAGAAAFTFDGPPIPWIGAITEVDVISSEPGTFWQMRLSVPGQGSVFRTTQETDQLLEEGFFRPTPPGFWPETESLVFPLPVSGLVPRLEFRRLSDTAPNLTIRVLVVAQPME